MSKLYQRTDRWPEWLRPGWVIMTMMDGDFHNLVETRVGCPMQCFVHPGEDPKRWGG
jgi:hypothetical protein